MKKERVKNTLNSPNLSTYLSFIDKKYFTSLKMKTFGEFLREVRKNSELTLTQMAAKLEMDSANLSKVENGKRDFDERKLQLLAELFDLDFNELKTEYYGEKFAKKMYEVDCSDNTLMVAEQKVKYLRQKNIKQGQLKL